jgi:uncharacterized phage protein (TIGR02218 family)
MSGDTLTTLATCWLLTRKDGVVFAFTDHDQDLVIGGITYHSALSYSRTAIRTQSDLAVDNLEVQGVLDSSEITDSDLRAGLFNNAAIQICTVDWQALTVVKQHRSGWLGQVVLAKNSYTAELRGLTQALQTPLGIVTSPRCRADLGDTKCQVPLSGFTLSDVSVDAAAKTFTTAAGNFIGDSVAPGFAVGQSLSFSGCAHAGNNGVRVITALSATVITCSGATGLVNEAAGAAVTIALTQVGTVSAVTSGRLLAASGLIGGSVRAVSYSATSILFNAPQQIADWTNGLATAGFKVGDQIQISGSEDNDALHTIVQITTQDENIHSYLLVEGGITSEFGGTPRQDLPIGIPITIATVNADYFAFGVLTWLTGPNAGLTMEVKSWDGANLTLFLPMPYPIQIGDTFSITPGCDGRWSTCYGKFNNMLNFRAEPYMAGQDAALSYPNAT